MYKYLREKRKVFGWGTRDRTWAASSRNWRPTARRSPNLGVSLIHLSEPVKRYGKGSDENSVSTGSLAQRLLQTTMSASVLPVSCELPERASSDKALLHLCMVESCMEDRRSRHCPSRNRRQMAHSDIRPCDIPGSFYPGADAFERTLFS